MKPNYKKENKRRKKAVERENTFLKEDVIDQVKKHGEEDHRQHAWENVQEEAEQTSPWDFYNLITDTKF